MTRSLGWIAAIGLSIGVVSLSLAYVMGGRDLDHVMGRSIFAQSCDRPTKADTSPSERRLAWAGDTVDIALPATVRFRGGEGSDIVVRGASDLIAHVEVRGNRIILDCRGGTRDVEITLPGTAFRRISLSGSATLAMENLSQRKLAVSISGSGSLNGQGTVDRLSVTVAGSGNAKLADVDTRQLAVKISGSGNVDAAPKDKADINIAGSGNVRLFSRPPRLKSHIAGSGRVIQAPVQAAESTK